MSAKQLTGRWLQAENNVGEVRARGTIAHIETFENEAIKAMTTQKMQQATLTLVHAQDYLVAMTYSRKLREWLTDEVYQASMQVLIDAVNRVINERVDARIY